MTHSGHYFRLFADGFFPIFPELHHFDGESLFIKNFEDLSEGSFPNLFYEIIVLRQRVGKAIGGAMAIIILRFFHFL